MTLMDKISKYKGGITVLGVILASAFIINKAIENFSSFPKYEAACEFYRGYENIKDGRMITERNYIFDPERRESRMGEPRYKFTGDPSIGDTLKLDKIYCFTFKNSSWPFAQKELVNIWPDASSNSVMTQN